MQFSSVAASAAQVFQHKTMGGKMMGGSRKGWSCARKSSLVSKSALGLRRFHSLAAGAVFSGGPNCGGEARPRLIMSGAILVSIGDCGSFPRVRDLGRGCCNSKAAGAVSYR